MSLKAVFFDLDGTLLDTADDLAYALNALLEERSLSKLDTSVIRRVVSDGAAALIKLGFGIDEQHTDYEGLRAKLLNYYLNNLAIHTHPFDGISDLIERCEECGIKWGIVTNKPWAYTEPLMEKYTFASAPAAVICPDHVENKKPHPEALLLACSKTNCAPSETIYIGDHIRDIECGASAGCATIAVGYGYIPQGDDHKNWKATHCVDHARELWPIINTYIENHEDSL